jgi:hypothetical protein
VRYEQLIAEILKRPSQTKPAADWSELLPEPPAKSIVSLSDIADALRVIATYEAIVAECDVHIIAQYKAVVAERDTTIATLRDSLESVFQSKSWKITSPLRTAMRIFRHVKGNSPI